MDSAEVQLLKTQIEMLKDHIIELEKKQADLSEAVLKAQAGAMVWAMQMFGSEHRTHDDYVYSFEQKAYQSIVNRKPLLAPLEYQRKPDYLKRFLMGSEAF